MPRTLNSETAICRKNGTIFVEQQTCQNQLDVLSLKQFLSDRGLARTRFFTASMRVMQSMKEAGMALECRHFVGMAAPVCLGLFIHFGTNHKLGKWLLELFMELSCIAIVCIFCYPEVGRLERFLERLAGIVPAEGQGGLMVASASQEPTQEEEQASIAFVRPTSLAFGNAPLRIENGVGAVEADNLPGMPALD